eukprot:RCo034609
MVKFLKTGRVVLVLQGKYAGKKAVILQNSDTGNKEKPYGHCVIAGVAMYPKPVTKKMSIKKIQRRSKLHVFIKTANHKHLMPTRYNIAIGSEFKGKISLKDPAKKKASVANVRKTFQERYYAGKNRWFFTKLRF